MDKIQDSVFGEMEVKRGWQKKQIIQFWGKPVDFKIKAAQYSNKEISNIQRENYKYVIDNIVQISTNTKKAVMDYIKNNKLEVEAGLPKGMDQTLDSLVSPRTIIFFDDGKYGILFDCAWDNEHGLSVSLPDYSVGPQDMLL